MKGKRELTLLLAAVCAVMALGWAQFFGQTVTALSWGLHFEGEGQAPQGPADAQGLKKYDAAYLDTSGEKVLYLTFDAGYENGCTSQILDVLEKHQVKAAFFLVGNYLERNADLVRRMVSDGHTVGNHTMHHPDMRSFTDLESFSKELTDLENLYKEVTGEAMPKFYRPPQGNYTLENLQMAQKLGYRTVFWSLAYADWDNTNQPDPEASIRKLLSRTHDGAVILLHSTSKTNAQILDSLLTQWQAMGYRFGTLEELFD